MGEIDEAETDDLDEDELLLLPAPLLSGDPVPDDPPPPHAVSMTYSITTSILFIVSTSPVLSCAAISRLFYLPHA
ncbi:MAG: hypothetical protein QM803_09855 [Rhodocyclaceae bacterium]